MTVPCDKGPALERIESKLDRLTEVLVDTAVLRESHNNLAEKVTGIHDRVEELEAVPKRAMWAAVAAALAAVINLLFSHWGGS